MRDLALVAWFEYRRHLVQRRFLAATLGLPVFMAAMVAVSITLARTAGGPTSRSWAVVGGPALSAAGVVLPDAAAAAEALAAGRVGGYVVLGPAGAATLHAAEPPPPALRAALEARTRQAVLARVPMEARARVAVPAEVRYLALEAGGREPTTAPGLGLTLAIAVGLPLVFAVAVIFATSFLVLAVAEEKENRLMEILVTATSPTALVGGKVLGLGALSLTQGAVWLASLGVALAGLVRMTGAEVSLEPPWLTLGLAGAYFLVGYVFYAAIMVGVGSAMSQPREAQQVAGFVGLFLMLPFMLMSLLLFGPDRPVAVALSLFPPTAPVAMPMRLSLAAAPGWQVALGLLVLVVAAVLAILAAARVFHATMLLYGQRLTLRGLVAALAK